MNFQAYKDKFQEYRNKAVGFLQDQENSLDIEKTSIIFTNPSGKYQDIILFQKFGISENSIITTQSDITTNIMEDNSTIQDHWAIMPTEYTATGVIGEVIYNEPTKFSSYVQENVLDYLKPLAVLSPTVSNYMNGAIAITKQVEANYQKYVKTGLDILQANTYKTSNTNQSEVFNKLEELRLGRELVTVWTPFAELENMAIKRVSMRQSSNSKFQSNIEIDFIKWNSIGTQTRYASKEEKAEFIEIQKQTEENKGTANLRFTSETGTGQLLNWLNEGK